VLGRLFDPNAAEHSNRRMHPAFALLQLQAIHMNSRSSCWSLGAMAGMLVGMLSEPAIALAEPPPAAEIPAYYLGAGVRGGKGDATAAVIDSKIKLADLGNLTLSTRPALLMGGYDTEWRLPFTVDGKKNEHGFAWFGGGGLAYNMDDLDEVDAMLTGGLDMPLNRRLIVNLTINFIWQSAISDDDTEFLATVNYGF
jgi:hypothetical protein